MKEQLILLSLSKKYILGKYNNIPINQRNNIINNSNLSNTTFIKAFKEQLIRDEISKVIENSNSGFAGKLYGMYYDNRISDWTDNDNIYEDVFLICKVTR